jgi:septal ring factor EnvC (AmiA/AmiB activator)
MARGDKTRELGKRLDDIHTKLYKVHGELIEEIDKLDGILHPKLLESLRDVASDFDSANDDVQSTYNDLDTAADDLDSDESEDESTRRELEKDLATANERIEELESENDDLSVE